MLTSKRGFRNELWDTFGVDFKHGGGCFLKRCREDKCLPLYSSLCGKYWKFPIPKVLQITKGQLQKENLERFIEKREKKSKWSSVCKLRFNGGWKNDFCENPSIFPGVKNDRWKNYTLLIAYSTKFDGSPD